MDELGLLLSQEIVDITNTPLTYSTRNGEKTEMFTALHLRFTWIDSEDGTTMVNDFYANGMNAFDKGLGSALTYGERYYLMKTFHIATDEDDLDALVKEEAVSDTAPEVKARRRAAGRTRTTTAEAAPAASQPAQYTTLPEDAYWKVVKAAAEGRQAKSGKPYREAYIEMTHAGESEIKEFDTHVSDYKAAHGIN